MSENKLQKFQFHLKINTNVDIVVLVEAGSLEEAQIILDNDFFKGHDFSNVVLNTTIQTVTPAQFKRTSLIIPPNQNGKVIDFKAN